MSWEIHLNGPPAAKVLPHFKNVEEREYWNEIEKASVMRKMQHVLPKL